MGELYNPFPKLPKNIRQIGERDQAVKLYMEDYVNTYLKRLYPKAGQDLRVGLLLGVSEEHDGTPYLFVDGAMEMEDVTEEQGQVVFTEAAWKKAYQLMEQMFPKRVVLGWFLCAAVFVRRSRGGAESLELLEAAWPVFCRPVSAYVSERRSGRRGIGICDGRGRLL